MITLDPTSLIWCSSVCLHEITTDQPCTVSCNPDNQHVLQQYGCTQPVLYLATQDTNLLAKCGRGLARSQLRYLHDCLVTFATACIACSPSARSTILQ
eukprot:3820529-Amphidinium_carterae.1